MSPPSLPAAKWRWKPRAARLWIICGQVAVWFLWRTLHSVKCHCGKVADGLFVVRSS
ncbi:hypothetical protein BC936DRAFT_149486, partial [Jimgerdemannia flammicorona]